MDLGPVVFFQTVRYPNWPISIDPMCTYEGSPMTEPKPLTEEEIDQGHWMYSYGRVKATIDALHKRLKGVGAQEFFTIRNRAEKAEREVARLRNKLGDITHAARNGLGLIDKINTDLEEERAYRLRLEENGPGLIEQMTKAIEEEGDCDALAAGLKPND